MDYKAHILTTVGWNLHKSLNPLGSVETTIGVCLSWPLSLVSDKVRHDVFVKMFDGVRRPTEEGLSDVVDRASRQATARF
jgi:hypothetical protein